jgi:hypothetical protein
MFMRQDVTNHPAFTNRFGQQSESLKAMFFGGETPQGDGGVGFLPEQLIHVGIVRFGLFEGLQPQQVFERSSLLRPYYYSMQH